MVHQEEVNGYSTQSAFEPKNPDHKKQRFKSSASLLFNKN